MSLLDNLIEFSNFRQGGDRASSLSLRTRFGQEQGAEEVHDRFASKSVSKPIKPKGKELLNPANLTTTGKVLFKLVHMLNRKLKTIRYFFFVKLETLKKLNIKIKKEEGQEEQPPTASSIPSPTKQSEQPEQPPSSARSNIQQSTQSAKSTPDKDRKASISPALESFRDCFELLYLKQYSSKLQHVSFKNIKRSAESRKKLVEFGKVLGKVLGNCVKSNLKGVVQNLKRDEKQYLKTELFVDIAASYVNREALVSLRQAFAEIKFHSEEVATQRLSNQQTSIEIQRRNLAELQAEYERLEKHRIQQEKQQKERFQRQIKEDELNREKKLKEIQENMRIKEMQDQKRLKEMEERLRQQMEAQFRMQQEHNTRIIQEQRIISEEEQIRIQREQQRIKQEQHRIWQIQRQQEERIRIERQQQLQRQQQQRIRFQQKKSEEERVNRAKNQAQRKQKARVDDLRRKQSEEKARIENEKAEIDRKNRIRYEEEQKNLTKKRSEEENRIRQRLQEEKRVRQRLQQELRTRQRLEDQLRQKQKREQETRHRQQQQNSKQRVIDEDPNNRFSVKFEHKIPTNDYNINNRRTSQDYRAKTQQTIPYQQKATPRDTGKTEPLSSRSPHTDYSNTKTVQRIQFTEKKPIRKDHDASSKKKIILSKRTSIDDGSDLKKQDNPAKPMELRKLGSCELSTKIAEIPIKGTFSKMEVMPKAIYRHYPDQISKQIEDIPDNLKLFMQNQDFKPQFSILSNSDLKSFTDSRSIISTKNDGLLSQMQRIREQQSYQKNSKLENSAKFTSPPQFYRSSEPLRFESATYSRELPVRDTHNNSPAPKQKISFTGNNDQKQSADPFLSRKIKDSCMDGSKKEEGKDWQSSSDYRNRRMGSESKMIRIPEPPTRLHFEKSSSSDGKYKPLPMFKSNSNHVTPQTGTPGDTPSNIAIIRRPNSECPYYQHRKTFDLKPHPVSQQTINLNVVGQYFGQQQVLSSTPSQPNFFQSEYYFNESKKVAVGTSSHAYQF